MRRRVTQASSVVWSRTCLSSQSLCVFSFFERVPQTPNSSSNTGNAQARITRGGLLFGYFSLGRARESNQLPVCHRRTWIPACAGMTGSMPRVCHPVNEISPGSATRKIRSRWSAEPPAGTVNKRRLLLRGGRRCRRRMRPAFRCGRRLGMMRGRGRMIRPAMLRLTARIIWMPRS